uniref:Putative secreted peptide n=1 Tax=Anopheles braziliensis TaxID=58242 RepID=A0A2M3ZSZ1_9DIPT
MLLLLLLLLLHSNRQENDRQEGMHGHGRTASVLGARRYLPRVPHAATICMPHGVAITASNFFFFCYYLLRCGWVQQPTTEKTKKGCSLIMVLCEMCSSVATPPPGI